MILLLQAPPAQRGTKGRLGVSAATAHSALPKPM